MSPEHGFAVTHGELAALILDRAAEAGLAGGTLRKLGRPGRAAEAGLFDEVLEELVAKERLLALPGKTRKFVARDVATSPETYRTALREEARRKGATGVSLTAAREPKLRVAAEAYQRAIEQSIAEGELIERRKGRTRKLYLPPFAPPSEEELAARKLRDQLGSGEIWLEKALASGQSAAAKLRRRLLGEMVASGELREVRVAVTANRREAGFVKGETASDGGPDWPAIETAARELARERFDGSVGIEELADRLGVSAVVVKTALSQQLAMQGPIELIVGEARAVRDPENAGLFRHGVRHFRFRFLEP